MTRPRICGGVKGGEMLLRLLGGRGRGSTSQWRVVLAVVPQLALVAHGGTGEVGEGILGAA